MPMDHEQLRPEHGAVQLSRGWNTSADGGWKRSIPLGKPQLADASQSCCTCRWWRGGGFLNHRFVPADGKIGFDTTGLERISGIVVILFHVESESIANQTVREGQGELCAFVFVACLYATIAKANHFDPASCRVRCCATANPSCFFCPPSSQRSLTSVSLPESPLRLHVRCAM